MVWTLDTDDFLGLYHNGTKYPLLRVINQELEDQLTYDPNTPGCGSAPMCDYPFVNPNP